MTTARIELPPNLIPVFSKPRGDLRYRGAYGGRGSAKSFTFAKMAAIWGYAEPLRILATRELQISIKESFHAEIKHAIESVPWLRAHYDVGVDYIRGANGTEFIFRGLRHNMSAIKSMAQIDLCIVEEAEDVPEKSWVDLLPTIRAPKSEFWIIWNPRDRDSPTDRRFKQATPPRCHIVEMNYRDNPWFPPELEEMRQADREVMDDALYQHVWEGYYLESSEAQVLHGKWRIAEFEADPKEWDGPYYGVDFGFSQDPTAGVLCWVHDSRLWVEYDAGRVGLELDDTAEYLSERIPGIEKHTVRADCSRPESISHIKRSGIPSMIGVKKWQGSVEDGIEHLRSYKEIVIHPRCESVAKEARLYSYKRNAAGDITRQPLDKHNHFIDAIRYALQPLVVKRGHGAPMPVSFTI